MQYYGAAPNSSMSMHEDPMLLAWLTKLFRGEIGPAVEEVVETGTFLGLGSTKFLAEAIEAADFLIPLATVEINHERATLAKRNLARFPFVKSLWGSSLYIDEAIAQIAADPIYQHLDAYPDIYIDRLDDPIAFYTAEMRSLGGEPSRPEWAGEGLLTSLLVWAGVPPLVVLDSAGGVGWLEFQCTMDVMGRNSYYLLLDDTHHIKHFRSVAHMEAHPETFDILATGEKWALASANILRPA